MSSRSKREYLEAIYLRYRRAARKKKASIKPLYSKEAILKPLKRIWLSANLPCSKRLKAVLPLWLPGYVQEYGNLPEEVTGALLAISPAAIDRLIDPIRVKYKGRGRSTTKPGTLFQFTGRRAYHHKDDNSHVESR